MEIIADTAPMLVGESTPPAPRKVGERNTDVDVAAMLERRHRHQSLTDLRDARDTSINQQRLTPPIEAHKPAPFFLLPRSAREMSQSDRGGLVLLDQRARCCRNRDIRPPSAFGISPRFAGGECCKSPILLSPPQSGRVGVRHRAGYHGLTDV